MRLFATLHPTMSNLAESCFTVNLKFYDHMLKQAFSHLLQHMVNYFLLVRIKTVVPFLSPHHDLPCFIALYRRI